MAHPRQTRRPRRKPEVLFRLDGEQRFRVSLIPYSGYVAIADGIGERQLHVTYADGELELMTPSQKHEMTRKRLAMLVECLAADLNINMEAGGSMTFRRADLQCGFEPDECYWVENEGKVRGRRYDVTRDPPPDLLLEIEISRSSIDRMAIFARFGVPEIWRYDGRTLSIEWLTSKGRYQPRSRSRAFPFLRAASVDAAMRFAPGQSTTDLIRRWRRWITEELAGRRGVKAYLRFTQSPE